jgi:hypothetical protein
MDNKPELDFENDRLLDKLLKEEPDYFLSDDFADNLVKKITIRQSVKQNMMEFLTILGTVSGLLVSFAAAYYFLNKETFMEIKSFVFNGYTPVAVVIILFVYFMDKVMLKLLNELK